MLQHKKFDSIMKKISIPLLLVIGIVLYLEYRAENDSSIPVNIPPASEETPVNEINNQDQIFSDAFSNRLSDLQVNGSGKVLRILSDDNDGSRHQRFILRLSSGQLLLVAHNIDLAPKIGSLKKGDMVHFFGEYEWNPKGGVVHWTHRDPASRHQHGWLKHQGKTYQ